MSSVAMPRYHRRAPAPGSRARTALLAVALVILAMLALAAVPPAAAWAQDDATLTVNSSGDTDTPDDELTLREAIRVVEGDLRRPLTDSERLLLTGDPGPGKSNRIDLTTSHVELLTRLPVITEDDTTVDGLPTTLSGGGNVSRGLGFRAHRLAVEEFTFAGFVGPGLAIDSSPASSADIVRNFRLEDIEVRDSGKGINLIATGDGTATFTLVRSRFLRLAKSAFDFFSDVQGEYLVSRSDISAIRGALDQKVVVQAEQGPIRLNWFDVTDTRDRSGNGGLFSIRPGNFETTLTSSNQIFRDVIGGDALTIDTSAKAIFNLDGLTVTGQQAASLKYLVKPLPDIETTLNIGTMISQGPGTGVKADVHGRFNARWQFLTLFDLIGIDVHAGPEVQGSMFGSNWRVSGRGGVGVSIKGARLFDFDFVHGFSDGHRNAWRFREFPDSVSVDDATVTNNSGRGFDLVNTHGQITNSTVSGNQGGGIHATGGSSVDMSGLTVENNGADGVALKGSSDGGVSGSVIRGNARHGVAVGNSDAAITGNVICFNGVNGINIAGDSTVSATGNTIDQNGAYAIANTSPSDVPAQGNDWGVQATNEMEDNPFPSNITQIFDKFDSAGSGFVDYNGWVTPPSFTCGGT